MYHTVGLVFWKFDQNPLPAQQTDTTNTLHYNVGKFLSSLLNPLILNEHVLTDSYDIASSIQNIPQQVCHEGY